MVTVDELIQQYHTDEALRREVKDILADGKVSFREFTAFCKKHDVDVSISDLPRYMEQARKLGFLR